jgi:oligopeptide transport system ATP-binding protein
MYAGRPVEYGSVDELFYQPLHPYTWGLIDSLPEYAVDKKGTLCPIKGQPPSLINVPSGCAFHPRCPFARNICFTDVPQFLDIQGTHGAACHFAGQENFTRGGTCDVVEPARTSAAEKVPL